MGQTANRTGAPRQEANFRWLWLTAAALGGALVAAILIVGPRELLTRGWIRLTEDTEYAPGFSEAAFGGIRVGDAGADVHAAQE
ncbi:MAG: hypothetical protein GY711_31695 [bacterium]|nr:hypothetical protein [bacterium]